jgi:hypothetical protein
LACGCAGGKKSTQSDPVILGDPVGDVRQVRATVSILGARANEKLWVKGTHVDKMLEAGWIKEL